MKQWVRIEGAGLVDAKVRMYRILRTTAGRWLKSPRDQILAVGAVAYLLVLETIGRQVRGPITDLFLSASLVVGVAWLAAAHSRSSISWLSLVMRKLQRLQRFVHGHLFRIGWDLRRAPLVPRRVPAVLLFTTAVCGALTLGALIWNLWQPISGRESLGRVSTVAFAAAQTVLWCALLAMICGVIFAAPALLRDLYVCHQMAYPQEQQRRIRGGWFFLLFLMLSIAGMYWLPVSWATLILAGSFLVITVSIWLPPRREFDFIWQPRGRAVVFSMSWRTYISLANSIVMLLCLFFILLAVGPKAVGLSEPGPETVSVSRALGTLASWISATGAAVVLAPLAWLELTTKRRDPAVPSPTRVHVQGTLTRLERRQVRDALRAQGWIVRFGTSGRSASEVPVTIGNESSSSEQHTDWPRAVSLDRFADGDLLWSIGRRDQIQRRRLFLRALQSLLKRARRRRYERSTGFLIAPQYWFVLGLTRDTWDRGQDDDQTTLLEVIPPFYHEAFSGPARGHFYDVCRAVEVDLIFLEDGVQWREFRRVLRMMFEHYDVHGGRRRIEELHFAGAPRVRVIIHEFELGAVWDRGQYPEPNYDELARARILHIFRDRGEEEARQETPMDWDRLPSPVPTGSISF